MKAWLGVFLFFWLFSIKAEAFVSSVTSQNDPKVRGQIALLQQQADSASSAGNDSLAIEQIQYAQQLAHQYRLDTLEAKLTQKLGWLYYDQNLPDSAVATLKQVATLYERLDQSEKSGSLYYNLGGILHDRQQYDLAEKYLLNSYDLFIDSTQSFQSAYWLGNTYVKMNRNQLALRYLLEALAYFEAKDSVTEQLNCYTTIGTAHLQQQKFNKARKFYNQALTLSKGKQQYTQQVSNHILLGKLAEKEEKYMQALEQYRVASQVIQQHQIVDQKEYTLMNLAGAFFLTEQYDSADHYFQQALSQSSTSIIQAHVYTELARVALAQQDSVSAYTYLQNSAQLLEVAFEYPSLPQSEAASSTEEYLDFLDVMAEYQEATAQSNLEYYAALAYYERGISFLLGEFLSGQYGESTQVANLDKYYALYERAIQLIYAQYQTTSDSLLLSRAYTLFEQSKAVLLRSTLAYQPTDSLAQQYLNQQQKVNEAYQQLLKAQIAQQDSSTLWRYRRNYIAAEAASLPYKKSSSSLFSILPLDTLRLSLEPDAALLTFFQGEGYLYSLTITTDTLLFDRVAQTPELGLELDDFYRSVSDQDYLYNHFDQSIEQLTTAGYAIYRKIIPAYLQTNRKKFNQLIVVPDKSLFSIPLEALLTQPVKTKNTYAYPFLCRDWVIRYAFSASQAFASSSKVRPVRVAGFSVDYSKVDNEGLHPDLAGSKQMLTFINDKLSGYTRFNTRKEQFLSEAPQYSIVHFGGHTDLNVATSDNHLLFGNRSNPDEILYAPELRNVDLSAISLVILSACNTGIGTYRRGVGVRSIAQSFAYAGVPSVMLSLFELPDKASAEVMKHFYQHLQRGGSSSRALQQAKLAYLQQMDGDRTRSHPVYWAGIIYSGEDQVYAPVSPRSYYYLWVGLAVGFAILLGVVARKTPLQRLISDPA